MVFFDDPTKFQPMGATFHTSSLPPMVRKPTRKDVGDLLRFKLAIIPRLVLGRDDTEKIEGLDLLWECV